MIKKLILALIILVIAAAAYAYYTVAVAPVTPNQPTTITIPTGSSYDQVLDTLAAAGIQPNKALFNALADRMAYRREKMRPGRYEIAPNLSTLDLIRRLRSGKRGTANVVLTTEWKPENVAAKAARFLEPDSVAFVTLMQNEAYLDSLGYTPATLQTLFIPNTYELYWHATPRDFMDRMVVEHGKFWDANNRRAKAETLGLTLPEIYTVASIVEKESLVADERPTIAGVYLNRLERGMLLQADPTVVFAHGLRGLSRVLYSHLELDSPYNTYKYPGVPPGPITIASPGSIDAVLEPKLHDYLYFCAIGDGSGRHAFAETTAGHARNIAVYKANLRRRGIR